MLAPPPPAAAAVPRGVADPEADWVCVLFLSFLGFRGTVPSPSPPSPSPCLLAAFFFFCFFSEEEDGKGPLASFDGGGVDFFFSFATAPLLLLAVVSRAEVPGDGVDAEADEVEGKGIEEVNSRVGVTPLELPRAAPSEDGPPLCMAGRWL